MLLGGKLAGHSRVVVELGMGDGRLLQNFASRDGKSLFVGIEIDRAQFEQARSRISAENALLLHGSFELLVPELPDGSVDLFVAVLPDPAFIDPAKYDTWKEFYRAVLSKLKSGGVFQLVTELTDELLQPVSDHSYRAWTEWLRGAFASLGFEVASLRDGAPPEYHSRCLDQFRGDNDRIKMVTIDFTKS